MLNHFLKTCLWAACCFLSTHPVNSQTLAPLPARVVTLDSGTVALRAYTCMDSSAYRVLLRTASQVGPLQQRVQLLEYDRGLLSKSLAEQRSEGHKAAADFGELATVNNHLAAQPLARPLLLDPHTYQGAGIGALALLLLSLSFH